MANLLPIVLALLFTTLLLLLVGAPPLEAFARIWYGAFGAADKSADVFSAWVPLTLCAAGLLITFTAGLWNIGIEGQVVMGAIGATAVVRALPDWPAPLIIPALFICGAAGGAAWAMLTGALKTYGKVHEIFGGLGLNFVAFALTNYLIFGPWKQPGGATMSGTEFFPPAAWLPTFAAVRLSPLALALGLVVLVIVWLSLRGTLWGLKLRAVGKNARSAFLLGIRTRRHLMLAFALCGVCAGLAGAVQAAGLFHRLLPSISSGYGYLAILVVLLAGFRALWAAPIALFFAALSLGSRQLQLDLQIDSSFGGVLQGVMVLFVVIAQGIRARRSAR